MPPPSWLIELPTCPSTNDWALAHLGALLHGACVWTRRQTAGRGRNGARWEAPPGVLTATFVLDLADALDATRLSLAVGLAICHAVDDLSPGLGVALKWPNDCVIAGRKFAGVLCERPAQTNRVVVGIGLNIDPQWEQDRDALPLVMGACPPISLAEAAPLRPPPDAMAMIVALRRYLIEACGVLGADAWATLTPALAARDWLRGRKLTLQSGGRRLHGTAAGIDGDGRLLIDGEEGRCALSSGHIVSVEDPTTPR